MPTNNYRQIFKWGHPDQEEPANGHVEEFLTQEFGFDKSLPLQKDDVNEVSQPEASKLPQNVKENLIAIVGKEYFSDNDFHRAKYSRGKFYTEILDSRKGIFTQSVDAVVFPASEAEIQKIIAFCQEEKIAIIPFAGGTSVTKALLAPKGGIAISMERLNRVLEFNETNTSITVEAGILGPKLEDYLNRRGFTCGHFPQSFEFATVGGWVAAKGAGQASTGYGKIENMVLSLRIITPKGIIETKDYPAASIGPDLYQIFIGTEGVLGIITRVTLKIRKYYPKNSKMSSFIFKDFESGVEAMRQVMQGQFGFPHFFRLQDPEETDIAFRMGGKNNGFEDHLLRLLGYVPQKRSLMHVIIDGDPDYAAFVLHKIRRIAWKYGAFETGEGPVGKWLEQRYSSAYLRDTLMDRGAMVDTLETAVHWDKLLTLWQTVRTYIKKRQNTYCLIHISHCYENGANLYFIFMSPRLKEKEKEEFEQFHAGIIETIQKNGGSLSHHHGVGKLFSDRIEEEIGSNGFQLLKAIKNHLDPQTVMNPGGTLGLD